MNLREEFEKETGYPFRDMEGMVAGKFKMSNKYVRWLEERIKYKEERDNNEISTKPDR